LAIVRELGAAGRLQWVGLAVRSLEKAVTVKEDLERDYVGMEVEVFDFDALRTDDHQQLIDATFAQAPVDCVISAFGLLGADLDQQRDVEGVRELLEVNYVAAVTTGTLVIKKFEDQGYGSLVVLSSVAAERSRLDNYVYASTKAGLDSWASGLADALAGTGIQVLVVRPGFVHTKMTAGLAVAPLATTPDLVAKQTVNALRRGSSLVWAPAAVRPLMSTLRHLPRPVFRAVTKRASKG